MRRQPRFWTNLFAKLGLSGKKRRSANSNGFNRRLRFEQCEDRRLLATYTVNVDYDVVSWVDTDSDVSLREAVETANSSAIADTILFDPDLNGTPITLGKDASGNTISTGQLNITESVTIKGEDPSGNPLDVTIDAGNGDDHVPNTGDGFRILSISGFFADVKLEINGLKLTGGDPETGEGGAILVQGGDLTIKNSLITGNASPLWGGGISFNGTHLSVQESTFRQNHSRYDGGALYASATNGSISVNQSLFEFNYLRGGLFGLADGAAAYIEFDNSTVTITNTRMSNNQALDSEANAGGLAILARSDSIVLMDGLQISNNHADDDIGGLVIVNEGSTVTMRNSKVSGNTASFNAPFDASAGIYLRANSDATTIIESSEISNNRMLNPPNPNQPLVSGGGLYILNTSNATTIVRNSTISGNEAFGDGGGILITAEGGNVLISHSTVTNNRANSDGDTQGRGGGIRAAGESTSIVLDHTIVAGNFQGTGATRSDIFGNVTAIWSLVGDNTGSNLIEDNPDANGNRIGSGSAPIDPGLLPLANNGGFTLPDGSRIQTHALLDTSPAINTGDPEFSPPPDFDQRGTGFSRVAEGRIDMGAFEYQVNLPPTIENIVVYGSSWMRDPFSFFDLVAAGEQLYSIPTTGVDRIDVHFSKPITVVDDDQIELKGHNGRIIPVTVPATPTPVTVLTLSIGELLADKYALHILDGAIEDLAGNHLDGDWGNINQDNGTPDNVADDPAATFQIGDGTQGSEFGGFRLHFAHLPGDYDGDGHVEGHDFTLWQLGDVRSDGDGDGVHNATTSDLVPYQIYHGYRRESVHMAFEAFDVNNNGVIDESELENVWYPTWMGADFNDDEIVDGQDWAIFFMVYPDPNYVTGDVYSQGDTDYDGYVGGDDFLTLQRRNTHKSAWYIAPTLSNLTIGTPPQVTNVIVSGSLSEHDPYSFDTADGSGAQLATVPVGLADTISIVFSENVNVSATSLILVGLTTGNVPELAEFSYDPLTFTATWRFEGWAMGDNYLLYLADSITDTEGNFLDGEWTNPESISTVNSAVSEFPSGDGQSGGAFIFTMTLLPGDANLDGVVDNSDYNIVLNNFFGAAIFVTGDFDGNGFVDSTDLLIVMSTFYVNLQEPWILADVDDDGDVDDDDLGVIGTNYGMTGATRANGDVNGDGVIDLADLDLAFAQFGIVLTNVVG